MAGKVDGEHVLFGCLLVQFLDGEIPAVASVSAAVDEDQRGRCLGPPASSTPASPRPPQASATASNLWSTLKAELIYWPATTFATRAAAGSALFRYMTASFNQRRIQAGLDGLSPDEYEHAWKASRPHPNQLP